MRATQQSGFRLRHIMDMVGKFDHHLYLSVYLLTYQSVELRSYFYNLGQGENNSQWHISSIIIFYTYLLTYSKYYLLTVQQWFGL